MSRTWVPWKSDCSANTEMPTREPRLLPAVCCAGALDESCQEGNVVAGDCVDEALGDPFLKIKLRAVSHVMVLTGSALP